MLYAIPYLVDFDGIHLSIGTIDRTHLVEAVTKWYDYEEPSALQTIKILRFFSDVAEGGKNVHDTSCKLLTALASSVKVPKAMPEILFGLNQTGKFDKSDLLWIKGLQPHEQDALIDILNCPTFPQDRREPYFLYLLDEDIVYASRLTPQLPLPLLCELFDRVNRCEDKALLAECVPYICRGLDHSQTTMDEFAKQHDLVFETLLYVLRSCGMPNETLNTDVRVLGRAIKSEQYSDSLRKIAINAVMQPDSHPLFSLIVLFMLKPTDRDEIAKCITLLKKNQAVKDGFIELLNTTEFDPALKDAFMNILLQEKEPSSFLLASQMAGSHLSLSEVRTLVKHATKLPQDDDVKVAISTIMKAVWHNDYFRKENDPEWFKDKGITNLPAGFFNLFSMSSYRPTWYKHFYLNLYTETDELFISFKERLIILGIDSGHQKLQEVISYDFARIKANRRTATPYYKLFLNKLHSK